MKIVLLTIPSSEPEWFSAFRGEYVRKIQPMMTFEVAQLKSARKNRSQQSDKIATESNALLENVNADDFLILFDERGRAVSSEEFAKLLDRSFHSGKKRVVLGIGGAFGVNEAVRKRADLVISLSGFVLNHVVAQVVVLEQIYRALTIRAHIPYHNSAP